jgi:CheY-like chemotaxis protein
MDPRTASARILHVDDNPAHRYAVSRLLRSVGFDVQEAATGREALEMAARIPDLILLDMRLPDITGMEVCRKLRALKQTANIPIVHVSATYWDEEWVREAIRSGADAYIRYPVEINRLVQVIHNLLHSDVKNVPAARHTQPLAPGSFAPASGMYQLRHGDGRTEERIYLRGDLLAECECCGDKVRFKLLHPAPYVFEDQDFRPQ